MLGGHQDLPKADDSPGSFGCSISPLALGPRPLTHPETCGLGEGAQHPAVWGAQT